ncbi:MAG: GNAT family N-acetyltransferase [Deltaproteobacteria bacterium]|nr:GNAT family N-acetyltransferase [Deltaproteobacteria bacterium]
MKRITKKDKAGHPFEIAKATASDVPVIMDMYRDFSPRPGSQGLPPEDPEACLSWVEKLIRIGENILAWRNGKVIGHAALVPDLAKKTGEFVIFVHQDSRNLGIGTELARTSLENAKKLGLESVWLTVAVTNFVAIRLYVKLGFEYCDLDECERTMIMKL